MDIRLGKDAKVYLNTGSYGSPTPVEIDFARNVTVTLNAKKWDASRRGSVWVASVPTMKEFMAEMDLLYQPTNTVWQAIQAAFFAGSLLDLFFLDGPIATVGSQGPRGVMNLFEFPREEPLEEGLSHKCKFENGLSAYEPYWFVAT